MKPREILARWNRANELGTDLHGKIERFVNGLEVDCTGGENGKEFAMFLGWIRSMRDRGFVPYRSEWVIYHEEHEVAGSVDCVMWNPATKDFWIIDWKRCLTTTSGFSSAYQNKCFRPPLHTLPETKLNEWSLQVNIYREILEDKYGLKVSKMGMVVLHSENETALEFWHDRIDAGKTLLEAWKGLVGTNDSSEDEDLVSELESEEAESEASDSETDAENTNTDTNLGNDLATASDPATVTMVVGGPPPQLGINTSRLPLALQLGGAAVPKTTGGSFQPFRLAKRFGAPAQTCSQAMLARHVPRTDLQEAVGQQTPTGPPPSRSLFPVAKRFRGEDGGPRQTVVSEPGRVVMMTAGPPGGPPGPPAPPSRLGGFRVAKRFSPAV
jgi:hypothetical protein